MIVSKTLSGRIVLRYTGLPVLFHVLFAVGVVAAYTTLDFGWLSVPSLPLTVIATALGVLLAFRNNNAYERWWEARTLWGSLVNMSRSFARQVLTFLPTTPDGTPDTQRESVPASRLLQTAVFVDKDGKLDVDELLAQSSDGAVRDPLGHARDLHTPGSRKEVRTSLEVAQATNNEQAAGSMEKVVENGRELVYAQIGFVHALRCHLRRQDSLSEIDGFFRPVVLNALRSEQNVPAAILVWMGARLRRIYGREAGPQDIFRLVAMDRSLTDLANILGACERIKNTPIPRQYDILPRVMVHVYLGLMPLGVVNELGWLTPIVNAIVSFLFIAMDAIGRDVETPFEDDVSDVPMTSLSRTIEINLRQMLGETDLPAPLQPDNGMLY
ncbi:bestrophin family protein [Chondromyces apiculatus]|uniref:Uncharacterized protein n=1 Tax=Chondromyces apiculatus DSM 436 TaxID=1192034 RepID=A0A017T325_9BACT|nr:bestrophin family ion channel [Chondromyces apiculatus]EYF02951.1 Hypothetical protein CAP_6374 [Chondromyces apiculatus DSM 436]